MCSNESFFFFQAEDGIRYRVRSRGLGDVYKRQALTDAFNVAFRIPNLFRRLFAEGAFSQAFVPVLALSLIHI